MMRHAGAVAAPLPVCRLKLWIFPDLRTLMRRLGFLGPWLAMMAASTDAYAQHELTARRNKGYYKAEAQTIRDIIAKFDKKTGVKVDLNPYLQEDIITKSMALVGDIITLIIYGSDSPTVSLSHLPLL